MKPWQRNGLITISFVVTWTVIASWALIAMFYLKFEAGIVPVISITDDLSWPWIAWWTQLFSYNDAHMRRLLLISAFTPFVIAVPFAAAKLRNWRMRRLVRRSFWDKGDEPRPLERGSSDNHGHARRATHDRLQEWFPPPTSSHQGVKVVGMLPDGTLLFDNYATRSRVSIDISGTRGGKTSSLITTLSYWPKDLPMVVLDPSCEIGPMIAREMQRQGRKLYLLNPDPNPCDENNVTYPWARHISWYNPLAFIDVRSHRASSDIRTFARYFIDDDGVKEDGNSAFFRKSARNLISCILADILWAAPPDRRTLVTMREVISLNDDDLHRYLLAVYHDSPSSMARQSAGRLLNKKIAKTIGNIIQEADQATAWLTDPALAAMVSGNDFSPNDIVRENSVAVIIQVPMDTLLTDPCLARVLFGSLISAKIASKQITDTLFVPDEVWLLGKMNALKIALFAGGKHGIVMHLPWQSMGQIEEIWGPAGRKFWLDNCAYITVSGIRDPIVAKEISDMCGTLPVVAQSEGDNRGSQGAGGLSGWLIGRLSSGRNVSYHEISRQLFMLSEVISDLKRDDLLLLGLPEPGLVKRALWFRIKPLDTAIDKSPFEKPANDDDDDDPFDINLGIEQPRQRLAIGWR